MVSIVIPAYNVENYIERCLDSVVGQTYENLEILIVNDGSTDATEERCLRYAQKDQRIRVISQRNRGLSEARNVGIKEASGEFLYLLDSDDWIALTTIEDMLKKQEETGADLVCGGVLLVYEDGRKEPFTKGKTAVYDTKEAMVELMCGSSVCTTAWNKLYRRELFEGVEYPSGKLHEDEFTTYKTIYAAKKVAYLEDTYYYYFQRKNGLMGQIKQTGDCSAIDALTERTDWLDRKGEDALGRISLLKTVEEIKYLYREYRKGGEAYSHRVKELRNRYLAEAKRVYTRKGISLKDKLKTAFWSVFLPMEPVNR